MLPTVLSAFIRVMADLRRLAVIMLTALAQLRLTVAGEKLRYRSRNRRTKAVFSRSVGSDSAFWTTVIGLGWPPRTEASPFESTRMTVAGLVPIWMAYPRASSAIRAKRKALSIARFA